MGIVESTILVMCQSLFFCVFCCCFCLVQFDSRSFNSVRHRKKISKTDMDWIKLSGLVLIQDNNLSNCAKQPCLSFNANFSSYSLAEIPPSDCLQIMVLLMRNVVQQCLAANNFLLIDMRKRNHAFLLLAIALTWKMAASASANNWSARHWQVTIFCSTLSHNC